MARTASAKVAISIDRTLLARAERLRSETGESRSALLSRAVRQLLRDETRARDVERYVEAYRRVPESRVERQVAGKLARRSFASLPWDDE